MLSRTERLVARLAREDFDTVREAYARLCEIINEQSEFLAAWIEGQGYEPVDCDEPVTEDGREIVAIKGVKYALRPEIHAERMAQRMDEVKDREAEKRATRETETRSVVGSESLSAMLCPKCGDALQHTVVCPACAAGKLGYRHRYTCACGGADLVSKEEL